MAMVISAQTMARTRLRFCITRTFRDTLTLARGPVSGRVRAAAVRMANPAFILRNHSVEAALNAAVSRQDFQPFEELLDVLSRPYEDRPELERYATPARPEESVRQTFCGT
jgi:uncharacterized protein YdiU (UPF0061 family)